MTIELDLYTRPDEVCIRKNILEKLKDKNIENIDVRAWPKRIRTSDFRSWFETEKYQEFKKWAEKKNMDLSPHFQKTSNENEDPEKSYIEVIFPVVAICIYENSDIKFVFPSRKEKTNYTVTDFMESIENGEPLDKFMEFDFLKDIFENRRIFD